MSSGLRVTRFSAAEREAQAQQVQRQQEWSAVEGREGYLRRETGKWASLPKGFVMGRFQEKADLGLLGLKPRQLSTLHQPLLHSVSHNLPPLALVGGRDTDSLNHGRKQL